VVVVVVVVVIVIVIVIVVVVAFAVVFPWLASAQRPRRRDRGGDALGWMVGAASRTHSAPEK
jgi:Flp pilus assembly protein TadB